MSTLVLLTGLMGSGKSTVANLIREKGYKVIDTDTLMKSLYDDPSIKQYVRVLFGNRAFEDWPERNSDDVKDRKVDLKYIKEVFFDKQFMLASDALEAALYQSFRSHFRLYDDTDDIIFVEAAPVKYIDCFIRDYKIKNFVNVVCSEFKRKINIYNRSGMKVDDAVKRDMRQHPFHAKDCYTIENDMGLKELKTAVDNCLKQIEEDLHE